MKLINSKKGLAIVSHLPFLMFYIVAVGLTTIIIVQIGIFFISLRAEIPANVEDELILAPRFYSSGGCFAYTDEAGTVYTGTLDFDDFEEQVMNKCFMESNVNYAFSLSLSIPEIAVSKGPICTFNWIENDFITKKMVEDVFVFYGGEKYNGKLEISVQNVQ